MGPSFFHFAQAISRQLFAAPNKNTKKGPHPLTRFLEFVNFNIVLALEPIEC